MNTIENYKEILEEPTLKVEFNQSRGYYLSFKVSLLEEGIEEKLGTELIQITTKGKKASAGTPELSSFNERVKEIKSEIHRQIYM